MYIQVLYIYIHLLYMYKIIICWTCTVHVMFLSLFPPPSPPPQSDYEGQIKTLLGYIDPSTDAVVVAGGDGTLLEVRY